VVGSELIPEVEDAVRVRFGGVEVVVRAFEGSEVFNREVLRELFDREAGKIIGHSIEDRGFVPRVFIQDGSDAD